MEAPQSLLYPLVVDMLIFARPFLGAMNCCSLATVAELSSKCSRLRRALELGRGTNRVIDPTGASYCSTVVSAVAAETREH